MKFLVKATIKTIVKTVERNQSWGELTRKEFIKLVKDAHDEGILTDKELFNHIMWARTI